MKTVAYLRVSTAQQDVRSQRLAILEYARKHDFRIDDFIVGGSPLAISRRPLRIASSDPVAAASRFRSAAAIIR